MLAIQCAWGQAFGRFGYTDSPPVPGFLVDREGFAAKFGAAEKFYFPIPSSKWQISNVSDLQEDVTLGEGDLSVNLLAPGFMIRFPKGFALKLRSTSAPFLSWKDASVGDGVPTPSVRWIAVSFKRSQPPVVLGFLDDEVSLQVDGKLGDWTLHTLKPYAGWVRVALPVGTQPVATDSAASLGQLSAQIAASNDLWWQPAPRLKELTIVDEDTAVEATWLFDRKGAVVPVGAALAKLGSYPIEIKSITHRLPGYTDEGPTTICDGDSLTVRLPINRVPFGRAITVGPPKIDLPGTVSAFDVSGVTELAFENLTAARDLAARTMAEDAVNELIQGALYSVEPHTSQRLPFAPDGTGIDAVAANALLYQAYTMSTRPSSQDNSLLTSVGCRRDWYTWRIWADDVKRSRRAGALAAVAGALCPEPERRLEAAMDQAGLAAQRGIGIFLNRAAGKSDEPTWLEPVWTIRNTLFRMSQAPRKLSGFAATVLGTVRIFGDTPVSCANEPSGGLRLSWAGTPSITLASGFPLIAVGDGIVARTVLGYTTITATKPGDHFVTITLPSWAPPLPLFVAPPAYDEPVG